jgi:hypothetical protein
MAIVTTDAMEKRMVRKSLRCFILSIINYQWSMVNALWSINLRAAAMEPVVMLAVPSVFIFRILSPPLSQ